eukprot:354923-Chlamydomonas_euryale.AAC.3
MQLRPCFGTTSAISTPPSSGDKHRSCGMHLVNTGRNPATSPWPNACSRCSSEKPCLIIQPMICSRQPQPSCYCHGGCRRSRHASLPLGAHGQRSRCLGPAVDVAAAIADAPHDGAVGFFNMLVIPSLLFHASARLHGSIGCANFQTHTAVEATSVRHL